MQSPNRSVHPLRRFPASTAFRAADPFHGQIMDLHDASRLPAEVLAQRFDLLSGDATEYALFLVDSVGNLVCWNVGAERLFGYRPDEVMGQHFSRFFSAEDVRN